MEDKKKINRCKYCHPFMGKNHDEYHCVSDGWENDKVKTVTEEECETCEKFKSKYIEYPIEVSAIENKFGDNLSFYECGTLVKIRPCGKEYKDKTYLGIYLGDLPVNIFVSYNCESKVLSISAYRNPAIFVPELKKIVYGYESWWGEIENPDSLKDITNEEINSQWYVQLFKEMIRSK